MGEFDALPGLSQKDRATKEPVREGAPGHGCSHNLLGAGSALAAVALKEEMNARGLKGTIRYYGTPAEEGGGGKIYMLHAGLFRDVDVASIGTRTTRTQLTYGRTLQTMAEVPVRRLGLTHYACRPRPFCTRRCNDHGERDRTATRTHPARDSNSICNLERREGAKHSAGFR